MFNYINEYILIRITLEFSITFYIFLLFLT